MGDIKQLLDYCATHPDANIQYHASDMILHMESDASYLSETKARSRAAGFFYLGNQATPGADQCTNYNGPVNILSQIMREVVSSAAEAELAALFYNCKEACTFRTTLEEMGHTQPATPVVTNNSTATGIANSTVKQRRSKAIDMRYYWVRDRTEQNQFKIIWQKGEINRADYVSKHHSAKHHQAVRSTFVHDPNSGAAPNYYQRLAEEENNDTPSDRGEGVLIPSFPDAAQTAHDQPSNDPRSSTHASRTRTDPPIGTLTS
jgi:hypothetical protein